MNDSTLIRMARIFGNRVLEFFGILCMIVVFLGIPAGIVYLSISYLNTTLGEREGASFVAGAMMASVLWLCGLGASYLYRKAKE
jgi:hypothetical protein